MESRLPSGRSPLQKFRTGLLDPARTVPVLEYWRSFIEASAREVTERGDMVRYSKLLDSEPGLMAASLAIHMQYEEILASELSREAGLDPATDLESRLLAAFLVAGNFSIALLHVASVERLKRPDISG